jgi:hypothetical protein
MITALAWKEYREHRIVWLAMIGFSALALVAVAAWQPVDRLHGNQFSLFGAAAVFLCWAYGLVCGGMLLAGECEDGTLAFLETLPALRGQLWSTKCAMGVSLVLAYAAVLAVCGILLGYPRRDSFLLIAGMILASLMSLGWGLLSSARGEQVLYAIGKAVGAQILAGLGLLLLLILFDVLFGFNSLETPVVLCAGEVLLGIWAYFGSRRVFCSTDWERLQGALPPWAGAMPGMAWGPIAWLCWRQMRVFALALLGFSLAGGLLVILAGSGWWAPVTLLIGLGSGVATFHDEKRGPSAFRFLGDHRFPPGRLWLVKTCAYFLLAVMASVFVLLPALLAVDRGIPIARFSSLDFSDHLFLALRNSSLIQQLSLAVALKMFLVLWLLHGYALGQLGSLLFRKTLASVAVSLVAILVCVELWLAILLREAGPVTVLCQWLLLTIGLGLLWGLVLHNTMAAVAATLGAAFLCGLLSPPSVPRELPSFWQMSGVPILALAISLVLFRARAAGRSPDRETAGHLAVCAMVGPIGAITAVMYSPLLHLLRTLGAH